MTQIFFYHGVANRISAIATLISKAYAQKKPLLVYAPDADIADQLDRHLWINPPTGFVPHVHQYSPLAEQTPVLITDTLENILETPNERLFNLSSVIPSGFSRFKSLIEVVGEDEEERLAGRERVRFYKDRGYEIKFYDLSGKT